MKFEGKFHGRMGFFMFGFLFLLISFLDLCVGVFGKGENLKMGMIIFFCLKKMIILGFCK
jgi:hypothetical protein